MPKKPILSLACLALSGLLMSCGGHSADGPTGPVQPAPATVASVDVNGIHALEVGDTAQLTAVARDATGNQLSGHPVSWSTNAPAVATVSESGLVRAIAAGSATITATVDGKSGTGSLVVAQPVAVASVDVKGAHGLEVGDTAQLTAVAHDAAGNQLSGRSISWSSSAPAVATVSASGLVTAVTTGSATITATVDGKSGSGAVAVSASTVASVSFGYAHITMALREVLAVVVTVRDAAGRTLSGKTGTLASSDAAVVAVQPDGSLSAASAGTATITISINGVSASVPVTVIAFASVFALANDVCAVTSAGVMYCAGEQFGPRAQPFAPETAWSQIVDSYSDDGTHHLCGLTKQSGVLCWGANAHGELGLGDLQRHDQPTLVGLPEGATQVATGGGHTCALGLSGNVYCWGDNSFGQIGDGTTTSSSLPVRVSSNEKFTSVATGGDHTCGLTDRGAILCWGGSSNGQIGRGTWSTTDASPIPTPVKSNLQFKTISTYTAHPCAVAMSGAAYCWGGNTVFQTGQATPEVCYGQHPCVTAPGPVSGGLTFDMVVSSDFGACGLAPDGGAHCWGMDTQSMLGATSVPVCPVEGATNCTSTPLPGPVGFKTITGGSRNYCGLRFDGGAYCWGGNRSGQLGVASTDQTAIPLVFTIDPGVTPP